MKAKQVDNEIEYVFVNNDKAQEALCIIKKYNKLNNDLEAYLFEIAKWGLDEIENKPNPKDYGIDDEKN